MLYSLTTGLILIGLCSAQEDNPIDKCPVLSYADGCSVPGNLPAPYKETFQPACNRHDMCYTCGEQYGWSRKSCDDGFYMDMLKICADTTVPLICDLAAAAYYLAVELLGESSYINPSPELCQDTCVIPYAEPTTPDSSTALVESLNSSFQKWGLTRHHVDRLILKYALSAVQAKKTPIPGEVALQVVTEILLTKGLNNPRLHLRK